VIPEATNVIGWRVPPRTEVEPRPKENVVVSFAHPLLRWLLYYYGLRLHDLTPQGILHHSVFIMLSEGFLGDPAHYELWRSLFWMVRLVLGGSIFLG
jgi:hypothetical protein